MKLSLSGLRRSHSTWVQHFFLAQWPPTWTKGWGGICWPNPENTWKYLKIPGNCLELTLNTPGKYLQNADNSWNRHDRKAHSTVKVYWKFRWESQPVHLSRDLTGCIHQYFPLRFRVRFIILLNFLWTFFGTHFIIQPMIVFRHYILNLLWISINLICVLLTLYHLIKVSNLFKIIFVLGSSSLLTDFYWKQILMVFCGWLISWSHCPIFISPALPRLFNNISRRGEFFSFLWIGLRTRIYVYGQGLLGLLAPLAVLL